MGAISTEDDIPLHVPLTDFISAQSYRVYLIYPLSNRA